MKSSGESSTTGRPTAQLFFQLPRNGQANDAATRDWFKCRNNSTPTRL